MYQASDYDILTIVPGATFYNPMSVIHRHLRIPQTGNLHELSSSDPSHISVTIAISYSKTQFKMSPQALNQPTKPHKSSKTMAHTTSTTNNQHSSSDPTTNLPPRGQFPPLEAAPTPTGPRIPPTQPKRPRGPSKTVTTTGSPAHNQPYNHGSAMGQYPRGQFPPLEAGQAPFVPRQPPRPNRIILPPDAHQSVSFMEFLRMTRSAGLPPRYDVKRYSGKDVEYSDEEEDEDEVGNGAPADDLPSAHVTGQVPAPNMPIPDALRGDSGFASGSNQRNVVIVDIHVDDDNVSTVYSNQTNDTITDTDTDTDTNTYSSSDSVGDPGPSRPRGPKCLLQNVRRFMKGKPLQRMQHNIELWRWERSQEQSVKYQERLQRKAMEKEQAAHVNFERDQARAAKEYMKDMRRREREGRVRYKGSEGKREAVGDWIWWVSRGRKKVKGERAEWEAGVAWEELRERQRRLREGDGTFMTVVRTSEVVEEETRRLELVRH